MDLKINPRLDPDAMASRFSEKGRIRVDNFLEAWSADAVHACLSKGIPWNLVYIDNGQVNKIPDHIARQMSDSDKAATLARIYKIASRQFQFFYNAYNLDEKNTADLPEGSDYHQIVNSIRSDTMIDFVSRISGARGINKVTVQASRYTAGHFLLPHDDTAGSSTRQVAFVINVSKGWNPGWGGLLQFHDTQNNIEEAWLPRFNSLALFKVPVAHSVSCVMPFALGPRLALSGWFQAE